MLASTLLLSLPLLAPLVAAHDTVHAAVIFSRHGDRTAKLTPPTTLTVLGQHQLVSSGQFWRNRYISGSSPHRIPGLNEDVFSAAQVAATAPDQTLLVNSAQAFLNGLYPPTATLTEALANGTDLARPLDGLQYMQLHTVPTDSPATLWLKGDDSCPAYSASLSARTASAAFAERVAETKPFYESFYDDIFAGVLPKSELSFANAYAIFDYVNVGFHHNITIHEEIQYAEHDRLRALADEAEFAVNAPDMFDVTDIRGIGGRALARKMLDELEAGLRAGAQQKLAVLFGSYDTFLSFFALTGLAELNANFTGLPEYAATMALEAYSPEGSDDVNVRFLFRNGTAEVEPLQEFELFGETLEWDEFKREMGKIAVKSTAEWCDACRNTEDAWCKAARLEDAFGARWDEMVRTQDGLTVAEAGVVGAMVTLGVFMLAVAAAALAGVRVARKKQARLPAGKELDESSIIA